MYKFKSDQEYESAVAEVETMLDAQPDPESDAGHMLGHLIDAVEEYEERTNPRIMGWLCARCNRSYNPDIDLCQFCEEHYAANCQHDSKVAYDDHMDKVMQCDSNFKGRGC